MKTRSFTLALTALVIPVLLAGCAELAIRSAQPKEPRASTTPLARVAVERFWASFREARYEGLPEVRRLLTAAYLETPTDPRLALLLAHAHLWSVAERARLGRLDPAITDHLILAERYFEEAQRLAPEDLRIAGWLGAMKLALGEVHRDERLKREGYFMLRAAAEAYIEFNGFSLAYPLIRQPHDSPRLREAIHAMERSLEACAGQREDRPRPALAGAPAPGDERGVRACTNTELAPHNVEGFFLHFGDLHLKQGDLRGAEAMYRRVRASPGYPTWRYKAALEDRLAHLEDWSRRLRDGDPRNDPPYLFNSPIACVACHAQ